jgi:hypothetical protein
MLAFDTKATPGATPSKRTVVLVHQVLEEGLGQMAKRVHGDDLLLVMPLREGSNRDSRLGVGEVGPASVLAIHSCVVPPYE